MPRLTSASTIATVEVKELTLASFSPDSTILCVSQRVTQPNWGVALQHPRSAHSSRTYAAASATRPPRRRDWRREIVNCHCGQALALNLSPLFCSPIESACSASVRRCLSWRSSKGVFVMIKPILTAAALSLAAATGAWALPVSQTTSLQPLSFSDRILVGKKGGGGGGKHHGGGGGKHHGGGGGKHHGGG